MAADLERRKQVRHDRYYMRVAKTVETGADCLGSNVGAVIVLENRIISTGYNGTPTGFGNCKQGGCVRCLDSSLFKQGRQDEMSDPTHVSGAALDRCICVHAEQNAIVTAARFGIRVQDATFYTTQSPCFGCLKESLQAGIQRIVYRSWYAAKYNRALEEQYKALVQHLTEGDKVRFEALGCEPATVMPKGQPDPYEDRDEDLPGLDPADIASALQSDATSESDS
jgi:dCMP deaminase